MSGVPASPLPSGELAAFVAAYEAGSIQGAAEALSLTQSAVTKRLQALERRLGARVLERGSFGARPTRLGETIYAPGKEALLGLDAVAAAARAARETSRGDLRLSASHTVGEFLLPGWLPAFRATAPEVHPQLEIVNSAGALAAVRDGRCAIAFIESGAAPADLERLTVARDELVVVVAAAHPWARRRSLTPGTLTRAAGGYLTRERDSGTRTVATEALAGAGVELSPALEVASIQSLKRMLGDGGFTILSRLAIAEEVRAGTLAGLPLSGVDLSRRLRALRRRDGDDSPAAHRFWQWLRRAGGETVIMRP